MGCMERMTLTVEEAAEALGVSRNHAYEMLAQGRFPVEPIRVGQRILIPRQKLIDLIEKGDK